MFRVHDRVRRRMALTVFVGLAIVPTAGVLAWGVARRLPSHVAAEAEALARRLGLDVALADVEHPRPGAVRYHGVELTNPENHRTILRCRRLEAAWHSPPDPQGRPKPTLLLSAYGPELDVAALAEAGLVARRALALQMGNAGMDIRCVADGVACRLGDDVLRLEGVCGGLQTLAAGSQLWCDFRPADGPSDKTVRLRLVRSRQTETPYDWFDLNTGQLAIPCRLLAPGLPPLADLGPEARFSGHLWAARMPDGWQGQLESVTCEGVELDRLVSNRFEHKLSGPAVVTIPLAEFQGSRITRVHGTVTAGPGQVSRSLLRAAVEHLGLAAASEPATIGLVVSYQRLACRFALDATGLRVAGLHDAVVLSDTRGPLLGASSTTRPAVALLQAVAPATAAYYPASSQTDWMAQRLPLTNPGLR